MEQLLCGVHFFLILPSSWFSWPMYHKQTGDKYIININVLCDRIVN